MSAHDYVHGYSPREALRLLDQATTLTELLHDDTRYPEGSSVLEAGCGVGAQTVILAGNSPGARLTSIDISPDSLQEAQERIEAAGISNVRFQREDLYALSFPDDAFDHVFVCFVLEHLAEPLRALASLGRILRPSGTITVIEGDHGSFYSHPETPESRQTVQCLIDVQRGAGGDALIGRRLYPLLTAAGFAGVRVSPRLVYVDASKPVLVEGFSRNTFIAMVEGVREQALGCGLMSAEIWDRGIADLYGATGPGGTFCYTFFKAIGGKNPA
jgi:SAM-dependent methyltransferase